MYAHPSLMTDAEATTALSMKQGRRVTRDIIEGRISDVSFLVLPGSTVTVCSIILDNGFSVRGESACIDPNNFDAKIGEKFAYEDAFNKLWPLFGFLFAERHYQRSFGGFTV